MVNPIQIQKYLKGVDYPADKESLIEAANSNEAPEDLVTMINSLPDKEFGSPAEVSKNLS